MLLSKPFKFQANVGKKGTGKKGTGKKGTRKKGTG